MKWVVEVNSKVQRSESHDAVLTRQFLHVIAPHLILSATRAAANFTSPPRCPRPHGHFANFFIALTTITTTARFSC